MEVPHWLSAWWNWWAEATLLFNWDALGAIFSFGALCWAIWLATQTSRDRRAHDVTALLSAAHIADYAITPIEMWVEGVTAGGDAHRLSRVVMESWKRTDLLERFRAFDRSKLPTMASYDLYAQCSAILDQLHVMMDVAASHPQKNPSVEKVTDALTEFRDRFHRLRDMGIALAGREHRRFALSHVFRPRGAR